MTIRVMELSLPAGYELCVHSCGEGPCVLLIHGFPLDASFWLEQMQPLAEAGYMAVAPDLRGFGRSTTNTDRLTPADAAEDMEFVRRHIAGDRKTALVGLSMGGYIAFEYAARYAEHVAALVLCNTKPFADSEEGRAGREAMAAKALATSTAEAALPMIPRLLSEATREQQPAVVSRLQQMIERVPPETLAAAQRGMAMRRDFSASLETMALPTHVITGEFDPIAPVDEGRAWSARIPNAGFDVVRSAGHLPPIEQPQEFNRLLMAALASTKWC